MRRASSTLPLFFSAMPWVTYWMPPAQWKLRADATLETQASKSSAPPRILLFTTFSFVWPRALRGRAPVPQAACRGSVEGIGRREGTGLERAPAIQVCTGQSFARLGRMTKGCQGRSRRRRGPPRAAAPGPGAGRAVAATPHDVIRRRAMDAPATAPPTTPSPDRGAAHAVDAAPADGFRRFLLLWSSQTLSLFGTFVSQ